MSRYIDKLSKYGELMTVEEFKDSCENGPALIDYDGHGYAVKDGKSSRTIVKPSKRDRIPKDATHIIWFNR